MSLLFEMIQETPWWVYLLFLFLVFIGLRATRARTVSSRQLFLLPIILMILNLAWLSERLQDHYAHLIFWAIGLTVGAVFGWLMVRKWTIKVLHYDAISLPPSWSALILILLFFIVRYFFVFNYEMHPEAESHLFLADALISGVMTGIFVGRAYQLFTKYHNAI